MRCLKLSSVLTMADIFQIDDIQEKLKQIEILNETEAQEVTDIGKKVSWKSISKKILYM